MKNSQLRFAIIGCGRISNNHIQALAFNKDTAILVSVCDVVETKAQNAAESYNKLCGSFPSVYTDYKKMLQEEAPDVCAIATESGYHAEISLYCLKSGKHVLVEKPMALSVSDAQEMIAQANSRALILGVCHQNRYNPPVVELRKAVEKGRFGKIVNGEARIFWNRNMSYYKQAPWRGSWAMDGGALMNQCIHNIDLLQWMMGGEPESIFAMTGNYIRDIEAEDFGAVIVKFKNGGIGVIEGSVDVYPKNLEETLSIFGKNGTAVIGGLAVNRMDSWLFEEYDEMDEIVKELNPDDPPNVYGRGHTPLYRNLIESINNGTTPLIDGAEGLKSLKIVLGAYKSQKTGLPVDYDSLSFSTLDMSSQDVKVRPLA